MTFSEGGYVVENIVKQLVEYASIWTLNLDIEHNIDIDGKNGHRLYSNLTKKSKNSTLDFFFLLPEEEKLCVCIPADLTIEGLKKTYGLALEEFKWTGLPNNVQAVCLKTDDFNLNNVLCREFLQHMMGVRGSQVGMELHADLSGNAGGCGGM